MKLGSLGKFTSMYDYQGNADDQLSFPSNVTIDVHNHAEDDSNWYVGTYDGSTGCFPAFLVTKIDDSPQVVTS